MKFKVKKVEKSTSARSKRITKSSEAFRRRVALGVRHEVSINVCVAAEWTATSDQLDLNMVWKPHRENQEWGGKLFLLITRLNLITVKIKI